MKWSAKVFLALFLPFCSSSKTKVPDLIDSGFSSDPVSFLTFDIDAFSTQKTLMAYSQVLGQLVFIDTDKKNVRWKKDLQEQYGFGFPAVGIDAMMMIGRNSIRFVGPTGDKEFTYNLDQEKIYRHDRAQTVQSIVSISSTNLLREIGYSDARGWTDHEYQFEFEETEASYPLLSRDGNMMVAVQTYSGALIAIEGFQDSKKTELINCQARCAEESCALISGVISEDNQHLYFARFDRMLLIQKLKDQTCSQVQVAIPGDEGVYPVRVGNVNDTKIWVNTSDQKLHFWNIEDTIEFDTSFEGPCEFVSGVREISNDRLALICSESLSGKDSKSSGERDYSVAIVESSTLNLIHHFNFSSEKVSGFSFAPDLNEIFFQYQSSFGKYGRIDLESGATEEVGPLFMEKIIENL